MSVGASICRGSLLPQRMIFSWPVEGVRVWGIYHNSGQPHPLTLSASPPQSLPPVAAGPSTAPAGPPPVTPNAPVEQGGELAELRAMVQSLAQSVGELLAARHSHGTRRRRPPSPPRVGGATEIPLQSVTFGMDPANPPPDDGPIQCSAPGCEWPGARAEHRTRHRHVSQQLRSQNLSK